VALSIVGLLLAAVWPATVLAEGAPESDLGTGTQPADNDYGAEGGPTALKELVPLDGEDVSVVDVGLTGPSVGAGPSAGRNPNVEYALDVLADSQTLLEQAEPDTVATTHGIDLRQGNRVQVVLVTQLDDAAALAAVVEEMGGEVETSSGSYLQALVPVSAVRPLADLPEVVYVREPAVPQLTATSEGVTATHTTEWHDIGYDGSGVKVAVISLGFAGYDSLLGTELPTSVITQNFRSDQDFGAIDEGTACAEIVHDMAPNAELYLVAFGTAVEFYNAVDYMIAEGVDIVTSSIGWTTTGPYDGTDGSLSWGYQINQKVSEAKAAGIFWAQSAGNYRDGHYEATFSGVSVTNGHGGTVTVHSFNDQGNWVNQVGLRDAGESVTALLSWDNWTAPVDQDYDLWVVGNPGWGSTWYILASSQTLQDGTTGQLPREVVQYEVPANRSGWYFGIAVRERSASGDAYLELYSYDDYHTPDFQFTVQSSSLCIPADNPDAVTAGATNVNDDSLEQFSSEGPTNGPGGASSGGGAKPDLVAPDRVTTVTYGPTGFWGTSAASPHVAGAAALMKQAEPSHSPDQLQSDLEELAVDLGARGRDNLYGAGRLELGSDGGVTAVTLSSFAAAPDDDGELQAWATLASLLLGAVAAAGAVCVRQTLVLDGRQ
jgi:subtilisin family serine protease